MPIASPHDVLTFWFAPGQSDRWYTKDEAFDAEIRQRFLPTYEAVCSGHLDAWREGPHSLLALIIVLDQFPRNMFRGSARAFAFDAQAARFTREGIKRGFDDVLSEAQLDFFLHATESAVKARASEHFRWLRQRPPALRAEHRLSVRALW